MNSTGFFSAVVVLAIAAAAVQPGGGAISEVEAAISVGDGVLEPTCNSTACLTGWRVAQERVINDGDECRLVSRDQDEVAGCRAFVKAALLDRF